VFSKRGSMRLARALFFAIIIAASSTSAEASMVNAEATADWTGFTFTTTGTLSVTIVAADQNDSKRTKTTPTTPEGSATAAASAVNGFLTTSAGAVATGPGLLNVGGADAFADSVLFFYATGAGSLVVTVPYHLELNALASLMLPPSKEDFTSASAEVLLFGGNSDRFALSLTGAGAMSHDGMLTTSVSLFNPTFEQLVVFELSSKVTVSAAVVPETTSTLVLLTLGLLVIGAPLACRGHQ